MVIGRLHIRLVFAWYDFWVGAYFDKGKNTLYLLPVPTVGVRVRFLPKPSTAKDVYCSVCGWESTL